MLDNRIKKSQLTKQSEHSRIVRNKVHVSRLEVRHVENTVVYPGATSYGWCALAGIARWQMGQEVHLHWRPMGIKGFAGP